MTFAQRQNDRNQIIKWSIRSKDLHPNGRTKCIDVMKRPSALHRCSCLVTVPCNACQVNCACALAFLQLIEQNKIMTSTYRPNESKREEFRRYLEKGGVVDSVTSRSTSISSMIQKAVRLTFRSARRSVRGSGEAEQSQRLCPTIYGRQWTRFCRSRSD